jgi:hypothetical protein
VVGSLTITDNKNVSQYVACWKNGEPVTLQSAGTGLLARSIAIVGNDIYISGFVVENGKQVACYWKNGIKTNLVSTATFSNAQA